ncbi:hypothetical protein [Kribbella sp. NPDC050470]|uniref:hypothetical protein n=1 Tax=unclassified Kribbella TaxID=2644121 RepID=UPI0037AE33BE
MYNDADVDACAERLRSTDSTARALAADEATDGLSDWGHHSYTEPQARRITQALVDALAAESNGTARESIVKALAALVAWDLAPGHEVSRAISIPRPANDPVGEYWKDIEEWASRHEPRG